MEGTLHLQISDTNGTELVVDLKSETKLKLKIKSKKIGMFHDATDWTKLSSHYVLKN